MLPPCVILREATVKEGQAQRGGTEILGRALISTRRLFSFSVFLCARTARACDTRPARCTAHIP